MRLVADYDDQAKNMVMGAKFKLWKLKMREKFLSKMQEEFDRGMNSLNETDLRLRANYDFNAPNSLSGQDFNMGLMGQHNPYPQLVLLTIAEVI